MILWTGRNWRKSLTNSMSNFTVNLLEEMLKGNCHWLSFSSHWWSLSCFRRIGVKVPKLTDKRYKAFQVSILFGCGNPSDRLLCLSEKRIPNWPEYDISALYRVMHAGRTGGLKAWAEWARTGLIQVLTFKHIGEKQFI
jgi:hypothetical protein